jgi:(p)ppGpp synthase/HD superfamily hydrolase
MTSNSNLLEKAVRIAAVAHKNQMRKEADVLYITHLIQVALILAKHGFSDTTIAAGLVHDTVEDTDVTLDQLRSELGKEVADIVAAVTNDDTLSWEEKKKKYIETVRAGSVEVKAVATADKIHNAESLIRAHAEQGTALWAHFNAGREKKLWFEEAMLAMLQETWQHPLVSEYALLVANMKALD